MQGVPGRVTNDPRYLENELLKADSQRTKRAQRAPRFPVHVPVRYRSAGAEQWSEGRIENISRSGVLFWTEQLLPVETPVELLFELPFGQMRPGVVCCGRIVRAVSSLGGETSPIVAASISRYRFVRH